MSKHANNSIFGGFKKPPFESTRTLPEAEGLVLNSVPPSLRGNLQNLLRVYHNTLVCSLEQAHQQPPESEENSSDR